MICSPSFLSCDFNKLESEIQSVSNAKWLHFDVMDGYFVPNRTYDAEMLLRLKQISNQFFDCHLMIKDPEESVQSYIDAGADLITFHFEATDQPLEMIQYIRSQGRQVGISVKPETPISVLEPFLKLIDLVLVMSVEPGAGGQKFMSSAIDKIKYLSTKREEYNCEFFIEVDGGINLETAKSVREVGCDVIVVGSFLFRQDERGEMIERLENV